MMHSKVDSGASFAEASPASPSLAAATWSSQQRNMARRGWQTRGYYWKAVREGTRLKKLHAGGQC